MTTFEEFYREYPRKKSRADARKAWDQAIRKGFAPDEIMAGLQLNKPAMMRKEPQFVPYPATWLRAESWADEPDTGFKPEPKRRSVVDAARDLIGNSGDDFWVRPVQH